VALLSNPHRRKKNMSHEKHRKTIAARGAGVRGLTTRILRRPEELADFARRYRETANLTVEILYMQRALVRGFFHAGAIVGGYILNSVQPFRYLSRSSVTDEHRNSPSLPPLDETVEGTCIWFDKTVGTPARSYAYFWLTVDFFASGKKYFLGGTYHAGVRKMQMIALPHSIFDIRFQDETGRHGVHHFYYGTRRSAITALPRWLMARLEKALGRRRAN
jgi:hypothetical protein